MAPTLKSCVLIMKSVSIRERAGDQTDRTVCTETSAEASGGVYEQNVLLGGAGWSLHICLLLCNLVL